MKQNLLKNKKERVCCFGAYIKENLYFTLNPKGKTKVNKIWCVVLSVLAGCINGLFGGGAGLVIVLLLQKVFKLPEKQSHASAIFIVLPLCIVSIFLYVFTGRFDFNNSYLIVVGFVLGGLIGATALAKIKTKVLNIVFALIVLFCAIRLLFN